MTGERRNTTTKRWRAVVAAVMVAVMTLPMLGAGLWGAADQHRTRSTRAAGAAGQAAASPMASPSAEPMPDLTGQQVRRALVTPKQLGAGFRAARMPRNKLGLVHGAGVPSCLWRGVVIPGPVTDLFGARRQPGSGSADNYYAAGVAYPNAQAAARTFYTLADTAAHCPARAHFKQTPAIGRWYHVQHEQRWAVLGQTGGAYWGTLRAIEHDIYPRSLAPRSTVHRVIDYVWRGNVVIVQTLHLWETRNSPDTRVKTWAATTLARTLAGLGTVPCGWDSGYNACGPVSEPQDVAGRTRHE